MTANGRRCTGTKIEILIHNILYDQFIRQIGRPSRQKQTVQKPNPKFKTNASRGSHQASVPKIHTSNQN